MQVAKRNESVDFLRAIAVLNVLAIHVSQDFIPIVKKSPLVPLSYWANGVQLFFIISGYTMLLTYGSNFDLAAAKSFYIRRFFRIAPMFWVAVIVYFIRDGFSPRYWAPQGISFVDIGLALSFLHGLRPNALNSVVPGGWSIAVEMMFYSMFPFFAWLFSQRKFRLSPYIIIAMIYCLGVILKKFLLESYLLSNWPSDQYYIVNDYFYFWFPKHIACFGFGFALFEIIQRKEIPYIGLFVLVLSTIFIFRLTVVWLFLLSYFVISLNISTPFFARIGRASYSMYINHFAVNTFVAYLIGKTGKTMPYEIAFFVVSIISFAIAEFITKPLIEDNFVYLGKRLSQRTD